MHCSSAGDTVRAIPGTIDSNYSPNQTNSTYGETDLWSREKLPAGLFRGGSASTSATLDLQDLGSALPFLKKG